jgi:hypothetical protein
MTPTTRYLCPLEHCGWHYDQRMPDFSATSGGTTEEIVQTVLKQQYAADEVFIREHLETHALLEWVTALHAARAERDGWKRKAEVDGERLGQLLDAVRERAEATGGIQR